ncbi:MAG: hypothetical protein QOJ35_3332 [Solirubrobacteraceae bacterium]|jgi:hypothetical protein|nr:hypothetical protein [Solirubrobacteraceae bacterium]
MPTPTSARRALAAAATAALALAVAPASAGAALTTFGSDLTAPANIVEQRQADTAYWQTAFADGHSPLAPASGQIRSFRVKGIALANPVAGVPGGETLFHLQALHARGDGTFEILRSSQGFMLPEKGADPQTVTTFEPVNFCIATGDVLVFNTVGGWDGIVNQTGPYPMGTPLQIFSRVAGASVSQFTGADQTNNGDVLTASPLAGHELLMQMTVGTGPDATPLCPGGTMGQANGGAPPPPPPPPPPQKATLPASQKVTVSKAGKLSVSVFCLPGASACSGEVRIMSRGAKPRAIGLGSFNVGPKSTGHATVFLNKTGVRLLRGGRGRLSVSIVAETEPGGAPRQSTLRVTLRRRGS